MASLFLSYDHGDAARAAPIVSALEEAGHAVWWDRHISGGAEYNDEIEAAVEKADAVVVLWSKRSVRSAWVRDEAAEGREQGKLIPVLIDAIKPPMGFRQFQTINLTRSGRGQGEASLRQLLDAIDRLGGTTRTASPPAMARRSRHFGLIGRRTSLAVAAFVILVPGAVLIWTWRGPPKLAVVAVAASDSGARSQALSSDLNVKLGTLAHVGGSKWQLADPHSPPTNPDLLFRVADTGSVARPQASVVLLDGKRSSVIWSREFAQAKGTEADLRLRLSLTAGRVLGCALEARATEELPPNLYKLFLAGCANEAETSNTEPHKTARIMRAIVNQKPRFGPAWSRLLLADVQEVSLARLGGTGLADAEKVLAEDIRKARKVIPDLRELKLIEPNPNPLSPFDYAGALEASVREKAVAPDMALIWRIEADNLARVGRLADAIVSARRAAELDPLSPAATTELIYTLAWGGQIELAKEELQKAELMWSGTDALRDAQWAFHLRYGDLKLAMALRPASRNDPYFRARLEPTPANVNPVVADIQRALARSDFNQFGYAVQALGEFDKTDEAFAWLSRTPKEKVAEFSYVLFRPGMAGVRRDPRFMAVAKRIGLLGYWRKSGRWPDFCSEPDLPYDCKEVAAKLSA